MDWWHGLHHETRSLWTFHFIQYHYLSMAYHKPHDLQDWHQSTIWSNSWIQSLLVLPMFCFKLFLWFKRALLPPACVCLDGCRSTVRSSVSGESTTTLSAKVITVSQHLQINCAIPALCCCWCSYSYFSFSIVSLHFPISGSPLLLHFVAHAIPTILLLKYSSFTASRFLPGCSSSISVHLEYLSRSDSVSVSYFHGESPVSSASWFIFFYSESDWVTPISWIYLQDICINSYSFYIFW